ncbi:MAG TPA: AAA family ATPase, partial [Firmicutes bacterium]|nr:AAA family ATPase [Bacillota bacterium]
MDLKLIDKLGRVKEEIGLAMVGQREVVDLTLTALLAGGHVLLEGVPGLGKTLLARTLAQVLDISYNRIQFTPDLMPSDITGT